MNDQERAYLRARAHEQAREAAYEFWAHIPDDWEPDNCLCHILNNPPCSWCTDPARGEE